MPTSSPYLDRSWHLTATPKGPSAEQLFVVIGAESTLFNEHKALHRFRGIIQLFSESLKAHLMKLQRDPTLPLPSLDTPFTLLLINSDLRQTHTQRGLADHRRSLLLTCFVP